MRGMTLAQYLEANNLNPSAFAAIIEVSSEAVSRYRDGERIPSRDIMQRIVETTGGAVTPNDFYGVHNNSDGDAA